jgi:hypothetical protein
MKKLLRNIVMALGAASCVPASEPLPPAGAGGMQTEPSAAAKGEAFVSRDGWRVTIDKLLVRASPQVSSTVPDEFGFGGYARSQPAIFNARESGLQVYAPEIPPGKALVSVTYDQYSIYIGSTFGNYEDYADIVGSVTPADVARFQQVADQGFDTSEANRNYGYTYGQGPCVVLELRASKDGREIKLKTAVSMQFSSPSIGGGKTSDDVSDDDKNTDNDDDAIGAPPTKSGFERTGIEVEIRADALALVRLDITPEKLFTTPGTDGIDISRLLAADANNDGEITGTELLAVGVNEKEVRSPPYNRTPTLLDLFTEKLAKHLLFARAF